MPYSFILFISIVSYISACNMLVHWYAYLYYDYEHFTMFWHKIKYIEWFYDVRFFWECEHTLHSMDLCNINDIAITKENHFPLILWFSFSECFYHLTTKIFRKAFYCVSYIGYVFTVRRRLRFWMLSEQCVSCLWLSYSLRSQIFDRMA